MSGTKGRSGGRREGAGRKPRSPLGARIFRTVRLAPETDAMIRQTMAVEFCTYAEAIDTLVRIAKQALDRAYQAERS